MSSDTSIPLPGVDIRIIRKALASATYWCALPTPTDRLFAEKRQDDFRHIFLPGGILLVIMNIAIHVGGWTMFGAGASAQDALYWWAGFAIDAVSVIVPVLLFLIWKSTLKHYIVIEALMAPISLTLPALGTVVLHDNDLALVASYVVMLAITIQVITMRLPLWLSGFMVLFGLMVAALLAKVGWGVWPDWFWWSWFGLGSLAVNLFVGAVQERQERISFLQSLLLQFESAERERLNAELERMAHQDVLTGIANRRDVDGTIRREWERLRREQKPLALLYIDVDYFKAYNDCYGHAVGDECLIAVAEVLRQSARRPGDVAARYGGEEFVIVLPATEMLGACEVAERIQSAIDALLLPHAASQVAKHVTLSIGVAVVQPSQDMSPEDLVLMADKALYQAKAEGRHRICRAT